MEVMRATLALLVCLTTCVASAQSTVSAYREVGDCAVERAKKLDVKWDDDTDVAARAVFASCEKDSVNWQMALQSGDKEILENFKSRFTEGPLRAYVIERQWLLRGK